MVDSVYGGKTGAEGLPCPRGTGLDKLCDVVRILRSPQGCPWDREQTHKSLRGGLVEEAYEVVDAIDKADSGAMREELGDVLLQVVFHAALAEEAGRFGIEDVIEGICEKLILRHPHVFGDAHADGSEQVLRNWEAIKREEKSFATQAEALRALPRSFPALLRADKLVSRAARAGYTPDVPREGTPEDIGGRLFAAVLQARVAEEDPELALQRRLERFIDEFEQWEQGNQAK